jgi:hypothetical protein
MKWMNSGMKLKTWSDLRDYRNPILLVGIPVFLVLLNLVLKMLYLGHRDLALDEPFTIFYAQADLRSLFEMLKTENNPPLHFVIMHYWIRVFGISAFAARFPSMLFSVFTVYFVYRIGKDFLSVRTGILAALIFTFSSYQMQFAHEARVYPLFTFLTVLSMFLFLRMSVYPGKKSLLAGYAVTCMLLVYSHFFGWIVLFLQLLSCLVLKEFRPGLFKRVLTGLAFTVLFYTPYFWIFISRFLTAAGAGTWVPAPLLSDLYTMIWRFSNAPVTTVFFLLALLSGLVTFFIKGEKYADIRPSLKTIMIWFFIPYIMMFLVSFKIPVFLDRYVIFLSPAFYLLVAAALDHTGKKPEIYYPLAFISVLLMAVTFRPDVDNNRRIRDAVMKIKELKGENTLLFICPGWADKGFAYYYNEDIFRNYRAFDNDLNRDNVFPLNSAEQIDTNLVKQARDVLYFEDWSELVDKDHRIFYLFPKYFQSRETFKFKESFILTHYFNP